MRKRWILALFILWSLAAGQLVQGYDKEEKRAAEVFAQVGTGEQTGVVEYYGVYKEEFLSLSEREMFLGKIAEALGIHEDIIVTRTYEDGKEETRLTKEGAKAKTVLRMITTTEEEKVKQYLILNITMKSNMEAALAYKEKIDTVMKPYGRNSRSSANIIGSYEGKLSLQRRNEIADELLEELGASVVSENREMSLYTIYAYTPWLKDYEIQEGEAVNVNIAMYYSEDKNQTFVYGAVPIAGLDY